MVKEEHGVLTVPGQRTAFLRPVWKCRTICSLQTW